MASVGAAVLAAGPLSFAVGFPIGLLGMALVAGAGYLDQNFLFPAIVGDPDDEPTPDRLLEVPQMTLRPGTPRVWAIGRRIRTPAHVIFQSDKEIITNTGGGKAGPSQQVRRIRADLGLAINDRLTPAITQIRGSGKLLFFKSSNLITHRSNEMSVATSGTNGVILTMTSTLAPAFTEKFEADDTIQMSGFDANGGPDLNAGFWLVTAITDHAGALGSTVTLQRRSLQPVANANLVIAGTPTQPAQLTRIDDRAVRFEAVVTADPQNQDVIRVKYTFAAGVSDPSRRFGALFVPGDIVRASNWDIMGSPTNINAYPISVDTWFYNSTDGSTFTVLRPLTGGQPLGVLPHPGFSADDCGELFYDSSVTYPADVLEADPADSYHPGDETQDADPILLRSLEPEVVPGYRGQAYQVLDQLALERFGNQAPLIEVLQDPDTNMLWSDAIETICERFGVLDVDTASIGPRTFEGYYINGKTSGVQALQPIMVAGQLAVQERAGSLRFFDVKNADVVRVANGLEFSDLGARSGRDTPNQSDSVRFGQIDEKDLPTAMVVQHMDVDNQYADGSQHFGLRNPSGLVNNNTAELRLNNLALTRREARDLAATALRRTWINAQTVELSLPVAYLDLLENDVITFTEATGEIVTARIIRREIGQNMLVNIAAVREELDLAVAGSPVQGADPTVPTVPNRLGIVAAVLDISSLEDPFAREDGLLLCAGTPQTDSPWAGAQVFESIDGGVSYQFVETLSNPTLFGTVTTDTLGTGLTPDVPGADPTNLAPFVDISDPINITIESGGVLGIPGDLPLDSVRQGLNWFLIGDEVVGATIVRLEVDGSYTLDGMLRGLRGTARHSPTPHLSGTRVIGLSGFFASGKFRPLSSRFATPGSPIPGTSSLGYKIVAPGVPIEDVDPIVIGPPVDPVNARPFPLFDVAARLVDAAEGTRFYPTHWSRFKYPVGFQGPWQADESFEGYKLEIWTGPTNGDTLLRTYVKDARTTGSGKLRDPWVLYPFIDKFNDGQSVTYWIRFVQLGELGEGQERGIEANNGRESVTETP